MDVNIKPIQLKDIEIKIILNMTVAEMRDFRAQLRNAPPASTIASAMDIAISKFDTTFTSDIV